MPQQEEKSVNEQKTRWNMDLLVLGHMLLSFWDTLLSSSVIHYSVQAGPVLVLHVVSIMRSVSPAFRTHTPFHPHAPAFTPPLKVKAKAVKWMPRTTIHQLDKTTTLVTLSWYVDMYKKKNKTKKPWQYLQSYRLHRQTAITDNAAFLQLGATLALDAGCLSYSLFIWFTMG